MRISAQEKAATRKRILDSAKRLFRTKGFEQATTRDIARDVGLATGTMFNYFSTKEAVVVELAESALKKAADDFARNRRAGASLEEDLFAHIAAQLRHLRPLRKFIRPVLETALNPLVLPTGASISLRADLADRAARVLAEHGVEDPSPVALNIYWSLYVGTLMFWGNDTSPRQEDTLAMLDQSLRMYVTWLTN